MSARRDQRINTEAIRDVLKRGRMAGIRTGTFNDFTDNAKATSFAAIGSQQEVNQLLQEMLVAINARTHWRRKPTNSGRRRRPESPTSRWTSPPG